MSEIAKLFVTIGAQTKGFEAGLKTISGRMGKFGKQVSAVGGTMTKLVTGPLVAGGAALFALGNRAANFGAKMNEVFTLLPGISAEAMGQMSQDVKDFSREAGVLPEKVVPALYQALSAGIPPDNVFKFLEVANKAAIGGVTDLETAVDGITSVVNAYGEEVIDAATASDLMFTAVKLGKTDFQQLSASLFNVIPSAAALGVEFGDVTAAIAQMTAMGTPTSVATTQIRQVLVELSKDGGKASKVFQEMAGVTFKDFIEQGGNVHGAMEIMHNAAGELGVGVNDLFGSVEAGNAALALSGENAAAYADNIQEMADAMGATDAAYEQMEKGGARAMERMRVELSTMALELGEKVLPIIEQKLLPLIRDHVIPAIMTFADWIGGLIDKFTNLDPKWQKIIAIAVGFLAAVGPVLIIVGKLILIGGVLIGVIKKIGVALMFLYANPVGLIILGITALIAAGVALYRNWDTVKTYAKIAWEYIKHGFEWMVVQISRFLNNLRLGFLTAINAILNLVAPIARILPAPFRDAFNSIKESVEQNIDDVRGNLDQLDNRLDESRKRLVGNVNQMRRSLHDLSDSVMTVGGVVADLDGNIMQDFSHTTQAVTKQTGSTAAAFGDAAESASAYAQSVASASKSVADASQSVADAAVAPLGLAERLRADIARVEAMRGDRGKKEFFRPFGGIEAYLASQHARLRAAPMMSDASAPGTMGPQVVINIHGPISSRDDVEYYADEIVKRLRLAGVIPS